MEKVDRARPRARTFIGVMTAFRCVFSLSTIGFQMRFLAFNNRRSLLVFRAPAGAEASRDDSHVERANARRRSRDGGRVRHRGRDLARDRRPQEEGPLRGVEPRGSEARVRLGRSVRARVGRRARRAERQGDRAEGPQRQRGPAHVGPVAVGRPRERERGQDAADMGRARRGRVEVRREGGHVGGKHQRRVVARRRHDRGRRPRRRRLLRRRAEAQDHQDDQVPVRGERDRLGQRGARGFTSRRGWARWRF